jgi:phosphate transport system substrate-binding protein
MVRRAAALALVALVALLQALSSRAQEAAASPSPEVPDVRIAAPISTRLLLLAVAKAMKEASGLKIAVTPTLTSEDALEYLTGGQADMAILTSPLTGLERAQTPDLDLQTVPIGMEVVALGVSDDIWEAGIHVISKDTMQSIYEQKIKNWSQLGGPDEPLVFYNLKQGQGTWEMLAEWLYGDNRKAPLPKGALLPASADARDALEFTTGALATIGASLVDGARCHGLGIDIGKGIAWPEAKQVASGDYPIVRPILAVVVGKPVLNLRAITDFMTGPQGQALVKQGGAFGLDAVPPPPADSND